MTRRRKRKRGLGTLPREMHSKDYIRAVTKRSRDAQKNCPWIDKRIREAMKERPRPALQATFKHLISLARDSARHGNCKRAGREIAQAKALGRRYGYGRRRDEE